MRRFSLLAVVVLHTLLSFATITFVQAKSASSNTVSALATGNFTANVTAGDMLVVFTSNTNPVRTLSSCTDTLNNNFHIDVGPVIQGSSIVAYMAHAYNVTGGKDSVTCTWSASGNIAVSAAEYTGERITSDPIDVTASGTGNSASWSCGTTATNHFSNELVVGGGGWAGSGTVSAGSSFNVRTQSTNNTVGVWQEDRISVGTGTQNATASIGSAANYACITGSFANNAKGIVNVVTDCGAKGDGLTDDGPTINTCLTNNPGRHIFFPKMCASVTGATIQCIDYKSSVSLVMSGNGQWLDGEVHGSGYSGVVIGWTNDVTGIRTDPAGQPNTNQSPHISNLLLGGFCEVGSGTTFINRNCWQFNAGTVNWNPDGQSDGIYVTGITPLLENVNVQGFTGNQIELDGSTGNVNNWVMTNVSACCGTRNNFFIHGGNANTGHCYKCQSANALLYGVQDTTLLGNTYTAYMSQTSHEDHGDPAGSTVNISSISISSNVATVTTATNQNLTCNTYGCQWVTLANTGDSTLNHTFLVTSSSSNTTFTFNIAHANASIGAVGTIQSPSTTTVLTPGVAASPYRTATKCSITSGTNTLTCTDALFQDTAQCATTAVAPCPTPANFYISGAGTSGAVLVTTANGSNFDADGPSNDNFRNGQTINLATNANTTVTNVMVTYGGGFDGGAGKFNSTTGSTLIGTEAESAESPFEATNSTAFYGSNNCGFFNFAYGSPNETCGSSSSGQWNFAPNTNFQIQSDVGNGGIFQLQSGLTANNAEGFCFYSYNGATKYWCLQTTASATPNFQIYDSADNVNAFTAVYGAGAETDLTSSGTGQVNLNNNGTGGTHFRNGVGGDVAVIDSTGKGTFNGGVNAQVALIAIGTAASLSGTGACATLSNQKGGSWGGQVTCTGTTGPSTLVISLGSSEPNAWLCSGSDVTTGVAGVQSGISGATCTLKFSSVTANDVITFSATGY